MVTKRATIQETEDLAVKLWSKGLGKEQIIPYLKERKYKVNSLEYSATAVAYTVAGIERVQAALTNGKLKFTKKGGLHIV